MKNCINDFEYSDSEIENHNEIKKIFTSFRKNCKIIFSHIPCHRCGWCCNFDNTDNLSKDSEERKYRNYSVALNMDEIRHFNKDDCVIIQGEHRIGLKKPCPFFIANACKTQNYKPYVCATYPLELGSHESSMIIFLCPLGKDIVLNFKKFLKMKGFITTGVSDEEIAKSKYDIPFLVPYDKYNTFLEFIQHLKGKND